MENKSSNPFLAKKAFESTSTSSEGVMTMNGTINKSIIMLLLVVVSASYTFRMFMQTGSISAVMPYMIGGFIGGLIAFFVTMFKKDIAKITSPIYAICEGLFLGGVSAIAEAFFPGTVIQAVLLTFGVFFIMLLAYRTKVIKPTQKLMMGIMAATGAIAFIYLINYIMSSFFGTHIPMIHSTGTAGIIFSLVVVAIAAFNLIIDFKVIEDGVEMQAPKHIEWYSAMGLMVTLVWLYLAILRLALNLLSSD